jgi:ketose-bisphosphate aldolase
VIDEDNIRIDYMSLINEAVGLGYDSVMIDGSRLSLEENILITKEVVSIAHKKNIPVEAELGAVLGHESGPIPPYEELFKTGKGFTDPGDAERFAKETGVDWLSVAVGNIHGAITGAAKDAKKLSARINIEHLKKLQKVTRIPTVLHGGSGIGKEYILQAVKEGLTKINIGTEIRQAYEKGLKGSGGIENAQKETSRSMEYLISDYFGIKGSKDLLDR